MLKPMGFGCGKCKLVAEKSDFFSENERSRMILELLKFVFRCFFLDHCHLIFLYQQILSLIEQCHMSLPYKEVHSYFGQKNDFFPCLQIPFFLGNLYKIKINLLSRFIFPEEVLTIRC